MPPIVVTYNGKRATGSFLLDTGAAASMISTKLAEQARRHHRRQQQTHRPAGGRAILLHHRRHRRPEEIARLPSRFPHHPHPRRRSARLHQSPAHRLRHRSRRPDHAPEDHARWRAGHELLRRQRQRRREPRSCPTSITWPRAHMSGSRSTNRRRVLGLKLKKDFADAAKPRIEIRKANADDRQNGQKRQGRTCFLTVPQRTRDPSGN